MHPAFYVLPIAYLIGFLFFDAAVRGKYPGWLDTLGERLAFYMWPRPPRNIIRLIMPNGDQALLYNQNVKERKEGVIIDTPLGHLRSPEKGSIVLPLTSIHVPGRPSPLSLVAYAAMGLIVFWIVFYYGYLLAGYTADTVFWTLILVSSIYIYMYYTAASTSGTEYHEYEVRGLAPPYLHAVPSSLVTSPIKAAKWLNIPIHIRVTKTAKEALDSIKNALGVESDSEVAELLAIGEFTETIMRKASALRVEASRVEEIFGAFRTLRFQVGRITIGKVALMALMFFVGLLVGWALSGGSVVVVPSQVVENATRAAAGAVHNTSVGVAGP